MKPLIFVHPLSETLKKLYEVLLESAESEGIELYEIDDMGEFNQLFPTIGQSVAIFGDPKKCAKALQANKKVIQKNHSKVILLSNKSIPKKTLEKFDKVGLTECIVEPVVPKTLLYKVKLHLRSIAAPTQQQEESKSFSQSEAKRENDQNDQSAKKFSTQDETEEKKSEDKKWSEENKPEDDTSLGDLKSIKQEGYQEEKLDGYYKGKVSKKAKSLFDEEDKSKTTQTEKPKRNNSEEDSYKIKEKTQAQIQFDQEDLELPEEEAPILESSSTKKDNKPLFEESNQDQNESQRDKTPRETEAAFRTAHAEKEALKRDQVSHAKREHLEKDQMRGSVAPKDVELFEKEKEGTTKKKSPLNFEKEERPQEEKHDDLSDQTTSQSGSSKIDLENNEPDHKKRKAENIEKYIKGSLSHQLSKIEDDDIIDNEKNKKLDIEQEESSAARKDRLKIEREGLKRTRENEANTEQEDGGKERTTLDIETDAQKRSNYKENQAPKNQSGEGATDKINHDDVSDSHYQEGDIGEKHSQRKTNTSLKLKPDGNITGEAQRKKEEDKARTPIDNHAQKIQKYYKGVGNSHKKEEWGNGNRELAARQKKTRELTERDKKTLDQDWDNEASQQGFDELKKKNNSFEDFENEKKEKREEDLAFQRSTKSEQTIDYKRLREEFEAISYDFDSDAQKLTQSHLAEKNKNNSYDKEAPSDKNLVTNQGEAARRDDDKINAQSEDFLKDLPPDILKEKLDDEEEVDGSLQIYEPRPQGLHHVIKLSALYLSNEVNFRDRLEYIAQNIYENYNGHVAFYLRKPETNFFDEVFVSYHDLPKIKVEESDLTSWGTLKEIKFPFWLAMTLPTWSDNTFQDQDCDYFFPFSQNQVKLGFAVVHFTKGFRPERSAHLEVYLDAVRGVFMEPHQKSVPQTQKTSPDDKTKKGFLGKLFKNEAS